jgi:hypothetical protein
MTSHLVRQAWDSVEGTIAGRSAVQHGQAWLAEEFRRVAIDGAALPPQ